MNVFFISSILTVISNFGIAVFVLFQGWRKAANLIFSGLAIGVGIWGLGGCYFSLVPKSNYDLALFWWQFSYVGGIFVPVFYTHFILIFLKLKKKKIIITSYATGIIFLFFVWFDNSKLFLNSLRYMFGQFYWLDWMQGKSVLWLIFYIGFYWGLLGYAFLLLIKNYGATEGLRRSQLKYFILSSVIGWAGAEGIYLPEFGIAIYPAYFNILIAVYPLIIAYAIIKYRLMDINLAITRTGIFVTVYSLLLGVPFLIAYRMRPFLVGLFGVNWWIIPLAVMTLLAMLVPFVYLYILRRAEDRLLREQRQYQTTLRQASQGMSRIRDLDRLLRLIVHVVTRTVHLKKGAIYLLDDIRQEFTLRAARDRGQPTTVFSIAQDSPLIAKLSSAREPLVYEEIKQRLQDYHDPELAKLEAQMKQIDAAVIVPSFTGEKLLGFIVLGEKKSGKLYSSDDLVVFSVLANQFGVAVDNSLYCEKLKTAQQQLLQSERLAAMGKFAASIVHEVKNPLTAIKTFTEFLPQKYQDKSFIDKYTEVVSREVDKMDGLARQLLDFSRPHPLELTQADIHKLLEDALEFLNNDFLKHNIKVVKDFCVDKLVMAIDVNKMRQVFLNLFMNAIDAMPSAGTLTVATHLRSSNVSQSAIICVKDTGTGIPDKDLPHLFEPFHSTKKGGTGLGLAVSYGIIREHSGEIKVESREGAGAEFIIELPFRRE